MAADRDGTVYCSSAPTSERPKIIDQTLLRAVETGRLTIGLYATDPATGAPLIGFALPSTDESGVLKGLIAGTLDLRFLERVLLDQPLPPGASFTITDRIGTVIARSPGGETWLGKQLPAEWAGPIQAREPGVVELPGIEGIRRIYGYVPADVSPEGIFVSAGLTPETAFADINAETRRDAMLTSLALLLALFAAAGIGQHLIRRPVAGLVDAVTRWGDGDYTARTRLTGRSEFGRIGAAFDKMAAALGERERQLREASRIKSRMLAVTAHDLRQPLQVIASAHSMIAGPIESAQGSQHRYAVLAERAIDMLMRQVDELGKAAQTDINFAELQPRLQSFGLSPLIEEVAALFGPQAAANGVKLRAVGCNAYITSDPILLATILHNLVGNAVKYTDPGGSVLVGARRRGIDHLELQVLDNGIGIPADRLQAIFEAFRRLDPSRAEGLGLGLSIVRFTAEMLGHRVSVKSTLGRGSCFAVELPVTRERERAAA